MGKIILKKISLGGAIFCMAFFSYIAVIRAATIEDLRHSIEQKNAEIKKLEEEAKQYRDEVISKQQQGKNLKSELTRIGGLIVQLRRDIAVTEKKADKKNIEIQALLLEISTKETSIEKLRVGLAGLVQILSERDRESFLEILLRKGPLSDFFREVDAASLAESRMLRSLETLRVLRKELEAKKAETEGQKRELQNLRSSLADQKKIQEGVQKGRTVLLAETKNQEKRYQELLRDTEKKQEEVLREIEELENTLRKLVDPSSLPAAREGFLKRPVEGEVISQGYGETPFTQSRRGRDFYKFHNGIDFAAPYGTPVMAAADGKILGVGDTDRFCPRGAYGKYIVIDHQDNLASMYAHLSLIKVAAGDTVRRGDMIGYVGLSGLTTGSHLHFTLYDARTVEIKPGPKGTCGPLPVGGSINPMLYL